MKSLDRNMKPGALSPVNSGSSPEPLGVLWMRKESEMMANKASDLEIMQAQDKFWKEHPVAVQMGAVDN